MSRKLPMVVYTSEPELRSLKILAKRMWQDLKNSRELAWRLMVRDISAHYRQSFLGMLWAFLPPLVTASIFIILQGRRIINIEETTIPYPVFALVGALLWQIFVYSFNAPLRVVSASKSILTRINFPRESLIVSSIGQAFFDMVLKLVVLMTALVLFGYPLSWGVPLAMIAVISLMLLGVTCGLFLTPIGLLYTDVSHGLNIITTIWFFLTPVVYPPPAGLPFSLLALLNPVSPLLVAIRDLVTVGSLQNPISFFLVTVLVILLFLLAMIVYRLAMPILIERISA